MKAYQRSFIGTGDPKADKAPSQPSENLQSRYLDPGAALKCSMGPRDQDRVREANKDSEHSSAWEGICDRVTAQWLGSRAGAESDSHDSQWGTRL